MPKPLTIRLRAKADDIDRSVSRDMDERNNGTWGEIELMREAADEIERLERVNKKLHNS